MKTLSVPWEFGESSFIKTWSWETEHFDAQIKADDLRFIYLVVDKSRGGRRLILDGIANSHEEAEGFILEMIGKAYPLKLGYRKYAGIYATTFRIYTGESIDFGPFEGRKVSIKVKDKQGLVKMYSGLLQLDHFSIVLTDHHKKTKIPPSFILEVKPEMSTTDFERIGKGRTVKGEPVGGCTGIAGFRKGTVDHGPNAPFCPIHQI